MDPRRLLALVLLPIALALGACSPMTGTVSDQDEPALSPTHHMDERWESLGYMTAQSGNVYIRFSDKGTYVCTRYDCSQVELHIVNGCPSNLYVEANVTAGGTVVGMTNASPGAVGPDSDVKLLLEDIRGTGDGFRLTKVSCL